jgi:hypothetical protein
MSTVETSESTIETIETSESTELNYEQIKKRIKELKSNYDILYEDSKETDRQRRELGGKYNLQTKQLKELDKEIKKYENYILQETILDDDIRSKPGFNLLTIDEIHSIIKGVDKTDYTKYGIKRFADIEHVISMVLEVKQIYPTWKLEFMRVCGSYDTVPPKNYYEFEFITPDGIRFSRGGLKICD